MAPHPRPPQARDADDRLYPMLGPNPMALLNVLFVVLLVGQALLTALFGLLQLSKHIRKRNAAMLNLLLVSILSVLPQPLLFYGQDILNPHPPFALCLVQAILKNGVDPMYSAASLALVLEVLYEGEFIPCYFTRKVRVYLLIAFPYAVFAVFAVITASLAAAAPKAVRHATDDYYCTVGVMLDHVFHILSSSVVVLTLALQAYTIVQYRRLWRNMPSVRPHRCFGRGLYLRVLAFNVCQLFLVALTTLNWYFKNPVTHIVPIAFQAAMPLVTFLIFASSPDVLAACMWWARGNEPLLQPSVMDAPVSGVEPEDPLPHADRLGTEDASAEV
ncbi:hypothetical protein PsYK624_022960 [Phanerochaete sordida]|uniref:Uncharacterized protein n=1 Tax=Phanerochaete sordida TaxID=48140 RepID=A0A9P3L8L5_9APHY|nr:hypothetical protein PsYK624_022960 [Phanerochaete sordida]